MEGTNLHNGTIQRADFRLIHPAPRQNFQITTRTTRQPWRNEGPPRKEQKNRLLKKELGSLMNNQDYRRKMNDNSEDKIFSITNGFKNRRLHILQDPMNSALRQAR